MAGISLDQHLVRANEAVLNGNWTEAIDHLKKAEQLQPTNPMVLTALGSCYLQAGQAPRSLDYFERAADLSPEVFEAHNNLGVACTLAGNYAQAEKAFRRALELDGENVAAWRNLAQACLQQPERLAEGAQILASVIQSHPEDVDALLMMGNLYEEAGELDSADTLYTQALELKPDLAEAADGKQRLAQIRSRQARIARPEHAKKLAALKGLKKLSSASTEGGAPVAAPVAAAKPKTLGYANPSPYSSLRLKRVFQQVGLEAGPADLRSEWDAADLQAADLVVFSQPNLSADLMNGVKARIQAGKAYAVDFEQDYHHMPPDHPAYDHFGPGNPHALAALESILGGAVWVSVSSPTLGEALRPYCKEIKVVLPGWDGANPLWSKPKLPHSGFHIGWIGSAAERPDLLSIKLDLVRYLRENPAAVLVIAGDAGAYEAFGNISEKQKLFLPSAEADEIPYILGQFDVLIVPWRDIPYNRAKSDLALVEAGARGIPWVASPIPSYREWGVGGVLVEGKWGAAVEKAKGMGVEEKVEERKVVEKAGNI